jgi:hypothetical protein
VQVRFFSRPEMVGIVNVRIARVFPDVEKPAMSDRPKEVHLFVFSHAHIAV